MFALIKSKLSLHDESESTPLGSNLGRASRLVKYK